MKQLFYFAYGSNILVDRIFFRVGKVKIKSTYRLFGWKLAFNCGFKLNSFANIVESTPKSFVEGVLYALTEEQIDTLDRYENYPHNYEKRYWVLDDGNIAFAYVSVNPFFKSTALPNLNYLNIIIEGCESQGLISTRDMLVKYKADNYVTKKKRYSIF